MRGVVIGQHSLLQVLLLQEQEPKEEYILIVDADNIMRFPFDPLELKVEPGAYALNIHLYLNYGNILHG